MVNKLTGLEGGLEVGQKINEIIDAKADVNADTTGNAGTATKLANARTITLSGDVSGSFSFDGSGNKTVTTSLNNTTKIDGQWVSKTETLSTATAVGTYTIDLSSYLPNDNYNYEVILNVNFRYHGTKTDGSLLLINNITYCINNQGNGSRTNRTIFHIDTQKQFTFSIGINNATGCDIFAIAYRRIGTNN